MVFLVPGMFMFYGTPTVLSQFLYYVFLLFYVFCLYGQVEISRGKCNGVNVLMISLAILVIP